MSDVPEAVICIPTFRRPGGLKKTLELLAAQVGTDRFAVVVVENDAERLEGKVVADAIFASRVALRFLCGRTQPRQLQRDQYGVQDGPGALPVGGILSDDR